MSAVEQSNQLPVFWRCRRSSAAFMQTLELVLKSFALVVDPITQAAAPLRARNHSLQNHAGNTFADTTSSAL